jgi:hypothetical protein
MKKFLIIFFVFLIGFNVITCAQYKIKTTVLNANKKFSKTKSNMTTACTNEMDGKTMTYTPYFIATRTGMKLNTSWMSYQKIDDKYYIFLQNYIFDEMDLDNSQIVDCSFLFRDGTKINCPQIQNLLSIPLNGGKDFIIVIACHHAARTEVSVDDMKLFATKPLVSISIKYDNPSKIINFEVNDKHAISNAIRANYFLNKQKLKKEDMEKIFNNTTNNSHLDWNY